MADRQRQNVGGARFPGETGFVCWAGAKPGVWQHEGDLNIRYAVEKQPIRMNMFINKQSVQNI
jgi:hypothetical protein